MDIWRIANFGPALLHDALADEADFPAMWKVLVRGIEMAERRKVISDDWEQFAFGAPRQRPSRPGATYADPRASQKEPILAPMVHSL